jgi:TolA-binding protein
MPPRLALPLCVLLFACTHSRRIAALEVELSSLRDQLAAQEPVHERLRERLDDQQVQIEETRSDLETLEQGVAIDHRRLAELSALVGRGRKEEARQRTANEQWHSWADARVTALERRAGLVRPDPPGTKGAIAQDEEVLALIKNIRAKLDEKDTRTARDLIDAALVVHGDRKISSELRFLRSLSLTQEGQHAQAIEAFHFFIEAYPDSKWTPAARLHMAKAFQSLGDPSTSLVLLEDILRLHPDAPEAATAKERLATARKDGT